MPSVGPMNAGLKNTAGGFFIPVGRCDNLVFAYTPGTGAGGSAVPGSFTGVPWAGATATQPNRATSTIAAAGAGGVFKDMGKTVVSASRVFRKVQLLVSSNVSTGGVNGAATGSVTDYLTGYIELMSGNGPPATAGNAAPVAFYPSMF
jgi:hypothetical protein